MSASDIRDFPRRWSRVSLSLTRATKTHPGCGDFGEAILAILITADRSPHVRAAAREENIAVLNKPVKPASLRALLGQWRIQQMVAAE